MHQQLQLSIGQCSSAGVKPVNQDFHAALVPSQPLLTSKGAVIALADGISSSQVSQLASETAVKSFLEDYFATPDCWSVKTSVQRVLQATNSWLYAQTRNGPHRYQLDRGYVCTFSALLLKSHSAHLFHIGDARIFRVAGRQLEQLTEDHRVWQSRDQSHLARALGMRDRLEFDYQTQTLTVGDIFLLATDGVYEFVDAPCITGLIAQHADDLEQAAQQIVALAMQSGSDDNLTVQIVRIDALPPQQVVELQEAAAQLSFPPVLRPRMDFDGYRILRELHGSSRSHVYLAQERDSEQQLVLKVPATDHRDDALYIERFLIEEWVARRLDNAHLLKPARQMRPRNYLYSVFEYIDGQTLMQWMHDHPRCSLEQARDLVEQIARGLYALHRLEILHQDLRPHNLMIDAAGMVRIIDFGSVRVAGLAEVSGELDQALLGTAQYTAPEYFVGLSASTRSDLYSLAVIAYQLLSGRLPYGAGVARASSVSALHRLHYRSLLHERPSLPVWVDGALRKALHPDPNKRYAEISEFVHDLRQPNSAFLDERTVPLIERDPLRFWKWLSLCLLLLVLLLAATHPALVGE